MQNECQVSVDEFANLVADLNYIEARTYILGLAKKTCKSGLTHKFWNKCFQIDVRNCSFSQQRTKNK